MKTALLTPLLLGALIGLTVLPTRAAEEDDLIAVLQSTAGAPQKWGACQRLRVLGSTKAIPALSALLTDERLSQAARHTLEALKATEAATALAQALAKTSGPLQCGIIDSLSWRGETNVVPLLAPLLADSDAKVAAAAAAALGRIGGADAANALRAAPAKDDAPAARVVQESLLKCAEKYLAANDNSAAASIYRPLSDATYPPQIRAAAWRGLALSEPDHRIELTVKALTGKDAAAMQGALQLVRQFGTRELISGCLAEWPILEPRAQLAVLEAHVKLGAEALPTARLASQSPDLAVRVAAWHALGELSDVTSVPNLAKAAALGDPLERQTARESLARLRGTGAREALLAHLRTASAPEKAELLLALGDRGDHAASPILIQNAADDDGGVRLAALESLCRLAPSDAVVPLLELGAKEKLEEQREAIFKALFAVCEASPNKNEAAQSIVQSMARFPAAQRRPILPLLAELATPSTLQAALEATRDPDPELAREAARTLARWPDAAPAEALLDLAETAADPTLKTLALRGGIEVAGHQPDAAKRLGLLERAFTAARQPEEQRQALGQLGQVPNTAALDLALKSLSRPELSNEAALAAVSIAEALAPSNPKLGDDVAGQILDKIKEGDVARRAWALRLRPSSAESFIRDWMVAGPYRQAGIVGATAVFTIPFGPEKPGTTVEWKAPAPADAMNLLALFPGQENCVAYLRTQVMAPQDQSALLLMGSDDGIKAWLNGQVVHSHNVDRGQTIDQDAAPIQLKKGPNELLLKVTQGGGGWSACARIVGTDGKPIPGLLVERKL